MMVAPLDVEHALSLCSVMRAELLHAVLLHADSFQHHHSAHVQHLSLRHHSTHRMHAADGKCNTLLWQDM